MTSPDQPAFPDPPPNAPPPGSPAPPGPWGSDQRASTDGGWAAPTVPKSILDAVKLMYVGAAISAISIVVTLLQLDYIRDEIEESDSSLTSSEVDAGVAVAVAFTIVVGLIAVGVWLWMASANKDGKRWARTVATVLTVLNVLGTLAGLAGSEMNRQSPVGNVVAVVGALVAVAVTYLLWRPESTAWYDARSPRR